MVAGIRERWWKEVDLSTMIASPVPSTVVIKPCMHLLLPQVNKLVHDSTASHATGDNAGSVVNDQTFIPGQCDARSPKQSAGCAGWENGTMTKQ